MKLRFDKLTVRESFASELKKASWFAGGIIGLAGLVTNKLLSFLFVIAVWSGLQGLAHVLLAFDDDET